MTHRLLLAVVVALALAARASAQMGPIPYDREPTWAAAVFVQGVGGRGAGYVAANFGLVVTTDRLACGPNAPPGRIRTPVRVTVNPGTPTAWTGEATVVGRDPARGLALVRLPANGGPVPPPLGTGGGTLEQGAGMQVFGFTPAGPPGRPVTTPAKTAARWDYGRWQYTREPVRLDRPIPAGAAGGPVLTDTGRLYGVAVPAADGRSPGVSVSASDVHRLLAGEVTAVQPVRTAAWAAGQRIGVVAQLSDPENRLRAVRAAVAPAAGPLKEDQAVAALPGAVVVPLRVAGWADMLAAGAVPLPAGDPAAVWVQVSWEPAERHSKTAAVQVDLSAPPAAADEALAAALAGLVPPLDPTAPGASPPLRDLGLDGVIGPDGQRLPPLATKPVRDDNAVNPANVPGHLPGGPTVVHLQTREVNMVGYGDGPSLVVPGPDGRSLGRYDYVLDRRQAEQFRALKLSGPVVVAVSGKLVAGSGRPWGVYEVRHLDLLGTDGQRVATFTRTDHTPVRVIRHDYLPEGTAVLSADEVLGNPDRWRTEAARLAGRLEVRTPPKSTQQRPGRPDLVRYMYQITWPDRGPDRPSLGGHPLELYVTPAAHAVFQNVLDRLRTDRLDQPAVEFVFRAVAPRGADGRLVCAVSHIALIDPKVGKRLWEFPTAPPDDLPEAEPPPARPANPPAQPAAPSARPAVPDPLPAVVPPVPPPADPPPAVADALPLPFDPVALVVGALGVVALLACVGVVVIVVLLARRPPPRPRTRRRPSPPDAP